MATVHAFVDECGNAALSTETPGTSSHFVLAAVLVEASAVAPLRASVEEIRRQHFQTGEMKSNGIGSDLNRRIRILQQVAGLPFSFVSLSVDKRCIDRTSGLIYKRSFLKFVAAILYRKLIGTFEDVSIVADRHGGDAFMVSFEKYMAERFQYPLFNAPRFRFEDSRRDPLVQLADILAGSIARPIDTLFGEPEARIVYPLMRPRCVGIEQWPPSLTWADGERQAGTGSDEVFLIASTRASEFLAANMEAAEPDIMATCEVLSFLLYEASYGDASRYVHAAEIIESVQPRCVLPLSEDVLRRTVVGRLRDAGVLIVSGSQGYKVPVSEEELRAWVAFSVGYIAPMAQRVRSVQSLMLARTGGRMDITSSVDSRALRLSADRLDDRPLA